jgi:hypothetical protein
MFREIDSYDDWMKMLSEVSTQTQVILLADQECWERYTDIRMMVEDNRSYVDSDGDNDFSPETIDAINQLIQNMNKRVLYLMLSGEHDDDD